jgi:hypothetical protein
VTEAVKLPVRVVTVETTRWTSETPNDDRSIRALEDTHMLTSVDDDPTRVRAVVDTIATSAPTTVTLVAPVEAALTRATELGIVAS